MIVPREKHGISLALVDSESIHHSCIPERSFDIFSAATTALLSDVYRAVSSAYMLMSEVDMVDGMSLVYMENSIGPSIGACRPGHTRALPGLFRSIAYSYHKERTRRHVACSQSSISVLTNVQTFI